ncbi:sterile alpha motif domain-containing protein 13 isoform X1 [Macrotis lagotis]|uniref:sterile alpha motif domain-containing protein 13 isoform X1 n=1 Tax=Macrotis lagotis TaxID=92651 RepID=UPI003D68E1D9
MPSPNADTHPVCSLWSWRVSRIDETLNDLSRDTQRGQSVPEVFLRVSAVENGRPPDPVDWAVIDVVNYFRTVGFAEQAIAFQEQEIDGKSLLLMTRNDVLTGLSLKLGPALKIYEYHVKPLQTQHLKNNSS